MMATYWPACKRERITVPHRRFWWIIKLCRLLFKYSGKEGFDETWEKRTERKDGTEEYEFFIRVILPKSSNPNKVKS